MHTYRRAAACLLATGALLLPLTGCGNKGHQPTAPSTSNPFDLAQGDLDLGGQATYTATKWLVAVSTDALKGAKWERVKDDGSEWKTDKGDTVRLGVLDLNPPAPDALAALTQGSTAKALAPLGITRPTASTPTRTRTTGTGVLGGKKTVAWALAAPTAALGAEGAPTGPVTAVGYATVVVGDNSDLDPDVVLGTLTLEQR